MTEENAAWRKCSSCKKPIRFGSAYWACSVSTCNRSRGALVFCSVPCWDAHLPIMNHREASAIERTAPTKAQAEAQAEKTGGGLAAARPPAAESDEILVVASKVKDYIRQRAGMNTSASVLNALSDRVRALSLEAIESAKTDGRQTVMDRDFGGRRPVAKTIIRRRPAS